MRLHFVEELWAARLHGRRVAFHRENGAATLVVLIVVGLIGMIR